MASLTPGTLQKLLQNVGDKDFKVAGEHRSALLQVIGIVPSLEDDPWKSRGYFLRVSDSLHSAYVSVPNENVELILNDKIQLGQLIHVARLDPSSPVPLLSGLRPIPKRRPCAGNPTDLISSDFLTPKKTEVKAKSRGKLKNVVANVDEGVRRLSLGNGQAVGAQSRRLSFDSSRKGWDVSPQLEKGGRVVKKDKSRDRYSNLESVVVSSKVFPHDSQSKDMIVSPKHVPKPKVRISKPSENVSFPSDYNKVTISPGNWSDSIMLWDSLPFAICDLGKETRTFRNAAFASAAHALEEASIYDGVLQCMSMFAELCESSLNSSTCPLLEQFLNLHERMTKAAKVISFMRNTKTSNSDENNDFSSQHSVPDSDYLTPFHKASLWVQAAVQTDLSKFSLYTKAPGEMPNLNSANCYYVATENNTPDKIVAREKSSHNKSNKSALKLKDSPSNSSQRLSNVKGTANAEQDKWSKGFGLRHADTLIQKLISSSRAWFLDYLENFLNNGFGVKNKDEASYVAVLGLLKRVNRWLDEAFHGEGSAEERIQRLRKKIYGFLLDHVDSAVNRR
ncbi:Plant protein of unknown function (DUF936 [Striga hermonthica]|uniref:Uncharacterized protein n=1 Tax=Striga hermonthica TaxID=68872 RepID=A0A9N7R053_STRHE|nr:Plant protein of unknown function (DUF936 [Striga hermonthica]